MTEEQELGVKVTARNNEGYVSIEYGWGATTEEAVADAIRSLIANTGDDSYVMDDWEAA